MILIITVINPITTLIVTIHLLITTNVTTTIIPNAMNPVIVITHRHIVPLLIILLALISVMRKPIIIHAHLNTLHS